MTENDQDESTRIGSIWIFIKFLGLVLASNLMFIAPALAQESPSNFNCNSGIVTFLGNIVTTFIQLAFIGTVGMVAVSWLMTGIRKQKDKQREWKESRNSSFMAVIGVLGFGIIIETARTLVPAGSRIGFCWSVIPGAGGGGGGGGSSGSGSGGGGVGPHIDSTLDMTDSAGDQLADLGGQAIGMIDPHEIVGMIDMHAVVVALPF